MTTNLLTGKVVLITGGTGSFGQAFTRIALQHNPRTIRLLSRGEFLQSEMERDFNCPSLRFLLGDVRDVRRLRRAFEGVEIVIHAAALKQVPALEYNPMEAVQTNVMGSLNVIDAAIDAGVDRVLAISSDKACYPVNLYGATKLTMEKLFIQANSYSGAKGPKFSIVRYGNVVGSRGSVIPLLLSQREKGTVTVTNKTMTRFWITLEQGINFSLSCLEQMKGGEVFIPKLPSITIMDLVEVVAPTAKIDFIGVRPGEKIHETLMAQEESSHCHEFEKHFVVTPLHPFWTEVEFKGGRVPPMDFSYTSENNGWKLRGEEIGKLLRGAGIEF